MKQIITTLLLIIYGIVQGQSPRMTETMIPVKNNGQTERRLALVVGNKDYSVAQLKNPINDASDMATTLEKLGFKVIKYTDLKRVDFEKAIDDFGAKLANYDVGLFYYSGHGLQANGENYLVPVDVESISAEPSIKYTCVDFGRVLAAMEGSNANTNLAILDACRNNPFKKGWSKGEPSDNGLTIPHNPPGTCIVFATSEGKTADDSPNDRNGLFTKALLQYIALPNLSLSSILNETRKTVYEKSNKKQLPADYVKLFGDFYFIKSKPKTEPDPNQFTNQPDLPFGPKMVYVPGGTFDMGSNDGEDDEKPVHTVTVSGFYMSQYETTMEEFAQFVAENNYQTDAEKFGKSRIWNPLTNKFIDSTGLSWRFGADGRKLISSEYNHPVVHVSHNDAVAYCQWLSKKTGKTFRLPSEAEWEYAAGNGVKHNKYSWGNDKPINNLLVDNLLDETFQKSFAATNYTKFDNYTDGYTYTSPVGKFKPNLFSLYDMSGNVSEWCNDWYSSTYYAESTSTNPLGASKGSYRVLRGGSWLNAPQNSRVAFRDYLTPDFRHNNIGFRVVSSQ